MIKHQGSCKSDNPASNTAFTQSAQKGQLPATTHEVSRVNTCSVYIPLGLRLRSMVFRTHSGTFELLPKAKQRRWRVTEGGV